MEEITAKKVEMGKEYVTCLHGLPVEILRVGINTGGFNSVVGLVTELNGNQTPILLNEYGYKYSRSSPYIREVSSFDHINIGDKVIVWDQGFKVRGHFAGVDHAGQPTIWAFGKTEWSSNGERTSYKFCEKVIEDEQSE